MKKLFLILFSIFLGGMFSSLYAQSECKYYHRKHCGSKDKDAIEMRYDTQSKSGLLGKGQSSEFHMVAHAGLDYRITICQTEDLGEQIHMQIFEKKRILIEEEEEHHEEDDSYDTYSEDGEETEAKKGPKYKVVKELIYDNEDEGFSPVIEFTAEHAKNLLIDVSVPGEVENNSRKLKVTHMGCVGVLIEHISSKHRGF